MNRREFLTIAAGTALSVGGFSRIAPANTDSARIDKVSLQKLVDETAKELKIVGAQFALFDGTSVHEFSTGFGNLELDQPVRSDTLFQIGSTTKVFNAALVMSLVEEQKLYLDKPVKTWLPDVDLSRSDASEDITLRHLLSMTAGIDSDSYADYGRGDDAMARYVSNLADVPLLFEPGSGFSYSNPSSIVAGLVAQRVGGESWESVLTDRILRPLSLEHSAMFAEDLLFHPVALGYNYRGDSDEPRRNRRWSLPRSMAPAGSTLCCSAGDLIRFARMFIEGGVSEEGSRVLAESSINEMHASQVKLPTKVLAERWGLGPFAVEWGGEAFYGHSGTNTSGSCMLLWCPARKLAVATLVNVPDQGYPFADRLFETVFPDIFHIDRPKQPEPDTVVPAKVDLKQYEGNYDAHDVRYAIRVSDGKLVCGEHGMRNGSPSEEPRRSYELIPLGDDRFLPADPAASGNRGWDVAFWKFDSSGRPTQYLNGVYGARRTR